MPWHLAQSLWHMAQWHLAQWHLAQYCGIWHNIVAFGTILWHMAHGIWHNGIWHNIVAFGTILCGIWQLAQFLWHLAQYCTKWHLAQYIVGNDI